MPKGNPAGYLPSMQKSGGKKKGKKKSKKGKKSNPFADVQKMMKG